MADARGSWIRRTLESPEDEAEANAVGAKKATPSTIEIGCEVEGELRLDGPVVIHGDFKGSIECSDVVTIGEAGTVQGPIRGRQVLLFGSVVGDVRAIRDVVIHAGSRLQGDVNAVSLVVERGAYFNGRTEMPRPTPIARSVAEVADAPTMHQKPTTI